MHAANNVVDRLAPARLFLVSESRGGNTQWLIAEPAVKKLEE